MRFGSPQPSKSVVFLMENDVFQKSNISWILDFSHRIWLPFSVAFSWKSTFFRHPLLHWFLINFLIEKWHQNGSQKLSRGQPFWLPKSTSAPKAIIGCTLVAFWFTFGTVSTPFWLLLALFWCLLIPFGSLLSSFLYLFAPLSPCCYAFRYVSVTLFNF